MYLLFYKMDLDTWQVWEVGRSALGETVAHAPPGRRGARSTPRGYAPLESSGNGWLRQSMQTFFYCDSQESQQRGKTPRVNFFVKNFNNIFDQFSRHFGQLFILFFDQKCYPSHWLTKATIAPWSRIAPLRAGGAWVTASPSALRPPSHILAKFISPSQ